LQIKGGDKFKNLSPINSHHNLGVGKSYLARGLIIRESRSTFLEIGFVGGLMHEQAVLIWV
jgi:hypothetical protein